VKYLRGLLSGVVTGATYCRCMAYDVMQGDESVYESGWLLGFTLGIAVTVASVLVLIALAVWSLT
jgi:hypothetical protein